MTRKIRGKSCVKRVTGIVGVGLLAVEKENGGGVVEALGGRAAAVLLRLPLPTSSAPWKRRGKHQRVKETQKYLEKHDPQYKQWKEEGGQEEGTGVGIARAGGGPGQGYEWSV